MNILITGCSYGVPDYYGSSGLDKDSHTEFLLKNLGYTVYNCSINGGSNLYATRRVTQFIKGTPILHPAGGPIYGYQTIVLENINTKIDWIVWFHTAILRDYSKQWYNIPIDIALEKLANIAYQRMLDLVNNLKCKIAVIGGAAPIDKRMFNYIKPDFIIEDWKSEILNEILPYDQALGAMSAIENSPNTLESKNSMLSTHEFILDKLRQSEHFPDGAHPGIYPHKNLSERLHKTFMSH